MKSINEVKLLGRVCKNPVVKQNGEKKVIYLTLETREDIKLENGKKEYHKDYHNIKIKGELVKVFEKHDVKEGMTLYMDGKTRSYMVEDGEGKKIYKKYIVAKDFNFIDRGFLKKENEFSY